MFSDMTPSARLQAAIEILTGLQTRSTPADRLLRDWFRARRYAGSKDRAAIGEFVFTILRHRASLGWRMGGDESPRALVLAALQAEGKSPEDVAVLFDGSKYGPPPLSDAETARLSAPPQSESPPLYVQGEFPAFLEGELVRAFGADLVAETQALCARAPVDLRVNTLKAAREDVLRALRGDGVAAAETPYSPIGIRIAGERLAVDLRRSALFESGAIEFQDEAAQIAAILCAAKPGERICDLAAGAGGKSLALAAAMENEGEIVACDVAAGRLARIGPRAARAGATIITPHLLNHGLPTDLFDAVLVDAPCSGSGTWRRQPELKWRTSPEWLAELAAAQRRLLADGAKLVRNGGRLIYATCSVLPSENEDRMAEFLAQNRKFSVLPVGPVWQAVVGRALPVAGDKFRASPYATGTDGFFACVMTNAGGPDA
jgi:16S rRNA (cytosine967-C5)-methyltransferase